MKSFRYGTDGTCSQSPCYKHEHSQTKKDNSYRPRITVDKVVNQQISNQLREDAEFLYQHDLIDYSALVGVTNVIVVIKDDVRFMKSE